MAEDAQSPSAAKAAAESNGAQPAEESKDATTATKDNAASPESAAHKDEEKEIGSAEEGSQEERQEGGDDEQQEGATEAPVEGEDDTKTPKKKPTDSRKTPNRRKSLGNLKNGAGTPASAKKTAPREYKAEDLVLHKLKGYPPWPAVVLSDEVAELKPDLVRSKPSGIGKRKGAKPAEGAVRTSYPVAYLHNFHEYSYAPVSDLEPLTKAKIELFAAKGKKKDLIDAYEVAKQGVTMEIIREAFTADAMSIDDEGAAPDETEDVDMEEPEEEEEEPEEEEEKPKKTPKKGGKKRKAAEASEEEEEAAEEVEKKPAKTPKRASTAKTPTKTKTPRGSAKSPNGEAKKKAATPLKAKQTKASAKKESKGSRSKKTADTEDDEEEEKPQEAEKQEEEEPTVPQVNPDDEKDRKRKEMFFIRHRLQRLLLSRNTVPSETEMPQISAHIAELENMGEFDVSNIRSTKINKVLRMITKLSSIPHDEEYKIRERAIVLLERVNQRLAEEPEPEPEPELAESAEGREKAKEDEAEPEKETATDKGKVNNADLTIQTKEKEAELTEAGDTEKKEDISDKTGENKKDEGDKEGASETATGEDKDTTMSG